MSPAEQKFWRLLGDYETLTREQANLLRAEEWNFPLLGELIRKKQIIFDELVKTGRRIGINRRHPILKKRLDALETIERENEEKVRTALESVRNERDELRMIFSRLQTLERTYNSDASDKKARFYAKV